MDEEVIAYIARSPGGALQKDLVKEFEDSTKGNITRVLYRLSSAGTIVKGKSGRYVNYSLPDEIHLQQ